MSGPQTWRDKKPGEQTGDDMKAAMFAYTGLRQPSRPDQMPAYTVAAAFSIASTGFSDRDLVEGCVIMALLGAASSDRTTYQPLIEKAIGRDLAPDEAERHTLASLVAERDRRQVVRDILD